MTLSSCVSSQLPPFGAAKSTIYAVYKAWQLYCDRSARSLIWAADDTHTVIVKHANGGDGQIIEMKYRDDYGNMILIDHGDGVYTRYAHLASFGRGLMPGVSVRAGEQLGLMGNSASYQIPMHLHYELLLGDYGNPKGSFGLESADPLSFPAAR